MSWVDAVHGEQIAGHLQRIVRLLEWYTVLLQVLVSEGAGACDLHQATRHLVDVRDVMGTSLTGRLLHTAVVSSNHKIRTYR